jgi:two-component system cell cycle sensor histidine kinase/response regulator CckA
LLQVTDSGCGMDADTTEHLFEPFFTTKEVGEGTGLGLSMVYGIVQHCQGSIKVESTPGQGATFTLSFPQISPAQNKQTPHAATTATTHGSESILLVEDEPAILQLTARILRSQGYLVYGASNGRKALERWQNEDINIDLLITDIIMPGLSGLDLADILREADPNLKVLFISGYADIHFRYGRTLPEDSSSLGKPYSPEQLNSAVHTCLNGEKGALEEKHVSSSSSFTPPKLKVVQ